MNLDHHITKWLSGGRHSDFFATDQVPFVEEHIEFPSDHFELDELPSFPRVVPPETKARHPSARPMAHDGGPGVKDGWRATRIKNLLREWL